MEKLSRVGKPESEKKKKKTESRKKYESSQHVVRMGKEVFDRWQQAKVKENIKTNNELAIYLLDLW